MDNKNQHLCTAHSLMAIQLIEIIYDHHIRNRYILFFNLMNVYQRI